MYFSEEISKNFAELEQNEKNFKVARIVDRVITQETQNQKKIYSAELGGGAHPDRYHDFFKKLIENDGHIDWVDISPYMLELAKKYISTEEYKDREKVITFIKKDVVEYLEDLKDETLDVAIMKYTIDHIEDLDELFRLLSLKLKNNGKLISTIGNTSPELKSYSTNARFLFNGEQFPDDETRMLKDGDTFTVKFFKVSGDPNGGYLDGAETTKFFHSTEKTKDLARKHGFEIFLGDWKEYLPEEKQEGETLDQDILVLRKNS